MASSLIIGVLAISGLFITALLLKSCGETEAEEKGADEIRGLISVYRQEIRELESKIANLEEKLTGKGESIDNRAGTRVTVREMNPEDFYNYFNVNGSVEAVREAMISPETNGRLDRILVGRGERVKAGDVVGRLNTSVIEKNIEELGTKLHLAETIYKRQEKLWSDSIGSELEYLQARNNYESLKSRLSSMESQLEMAVLRAPFSGIVDDIFLKEGELTMPGNPVLQMINLEKLFINAEISEKYLPVINKGDSVILRFPSFPDYESSEPVYRTGNVINPENRTFRLQLLIDNPGERFKPNMVAKLGVRSSASRDALVVPSILVKQDVRGHYLFTAEENTSGQHYAKKIYIVRGEEGEGKTVIESGLEAGDLLISEGHNMVNDGTPLIIEYD